MVHSLTSNITPPEHFTFPFDYTPHPLVLHAGNEVQEHLKRRCIDSKSQGKMYGVLVAFTSEGTLSFIAASSGSSTSDKYFVPSIYELPKNSIPTNANKSRELQLNLFRQYHLLNAHQQSKDIIEIFQDFHSDTPTRRFFGMPRDLVSPTSNTEHIPPAATGECCAPKLLQYAYLHNLRPLCMGEFWWGQSPKGEIKHHGQWYPACNSKCKPLLSWMLQGIDVEPNPLLIRIQKTVHQLQIIYEDNDIVVVNKPSGLLSVPGNFIAPNVEEIIRHRYHIDNDTPTIVHRLDMDTSGIMILARTKDAHETLQRQFFRHEIHKKYIALLVHDSTHDANKNVHHSSLSSNGLMISLPISRDVKNPPCQKINHIQGKEALTRYDIIGNEIFNGLEVTRVAFYPLTGRTHQLRLHAASQEGLNAPILGDSLYGLKSYNLVDSSQSSFSPTRLYLQAIAIDFFHPTTHKSIHLEVKEEF